MSRDTCRDAQACTKSSDKSPGTPGASGQRRAAWEGMEAWSEDMQTSWHYDIMALTETRRIVSHRMHATDLGHEAICFPKRMTPRTMNA
jgi:hypothetical protein